MEKDKKYYTPLIEEFHVGFEYEIFEDFDFYPEKSWHRQVYGENGRDLETIGYVSQNCIDTGLIRVKYLDKEDIESLGWKLSELQSNNYEKPNTVYTRNDLWLTLWEGWIEIQNDFSVLFKGKINIKNKAELKKLMQQLNINE